MEQGRKAALFVIAYAVLGIVAAALGSGVFKQIAGGVFFGAIAGGVIFAINQYKEENKEDWVIGLSLLFVFLIIGWSANVTASKKVDSAGSEATSNSATVESPGLTDGLTSTWSSDKLVLPPDSGLRETPPLVPTWIPNRGPFSDFLTENKEMDSNK